MQLTKTKGTSRFWLPFVETKWKEKNRVFSCHLTPVTCLGLHLYEVKGHVLQRHFPRSRAAPSCWRCLLWDMWAKVFRFHKGAAVAMLWKPWTVQWQWVLSQELLSLSWCAFSVCCAFSFQHCAGLHMCSGTCLSKTWENFRKYRKPTETGLSLTRREKRSSSITFLAALQMLQPFWTKE